MITFSEFREKTEVIAEAMKHDASKHKPSNRLLNLAKQAKVDISNLCPKQLEMGIKVEREHNGKMGKDTKVINNDEGALKIAVAHLREIADYYTRLDKMEKSAH
jgi:hypothetical protein